MNGMIRNKRWFAAGFLLVLFCSYMVSVSCFVHSHVINGQTVTHSHPYRSAPDSPGHSHTTAQFISIALLSHIVMLSATLAGVYVFFGKIIIRKLFPVFFCELTQIYTRPLRAPPLS